MSGCTLSENEGDESVPLVDGNPRLLSINTLVSMLGIEKAQLRSVAAEVHKYYRPVDIRRGDGGKWRHLDRPRDELKLIQSRIQRGLLVRVCYPNMMFGSVRGRSVRGNAEVHTGQKFVLTVDLKDCFPNTTHRQVFNAWMRVFHCSDEVASLLTKLTTFHRRLPQGTPTSPLLANLTLLPMYAAVSALAKRLDLRFSFFVDDIAVSGDRAPEALGPLLEIIRSHGHAVSRRKIRLMSKDEVQRTPGTIVNSKVSNGRKRMAELRREVYLLATSGSITTNDLQRVDGMIYHASHICPEQGAALRRFANRLLEKTVVVGDDDKLKLQDGLGRKLERRACSSFARHRAGRNVTNGGSDSSKQVAGGPETNIAAV